MGNVVSVSARNGFGLGKTPLASIMLIAGEGVEGDYHRGVKVRHRHRVKQNPDQPNLRQVHLIHAELFDELAAKGFAVAPGDLGENITTGGIDLLALAEGSVLTFPSGATVEITGLRNPCSQIDGHTPGLMNATLDRAGDGSLIRKAGVMGVVLTGGEIRAGDAVAVTLPAGKIRALEPV